jgi:hypothetical protein
MAKVITETVVVTLSKLVKESDNVMQIVTDEDLPKIEEVVQAVLDDESIVVEVQNISDLES